MTLFGLLYQIQTSVSEILNVGPMAGIAQAKITWGCETVTIAVEQIPSSFFFC